MQIGNGEVGIVWFMDVYCNNKIIIILSGNTSKLVNLGRRNTTIQ